MSGRKRLDQVLEAEPSGPLGICVLIMPVAPLYDSMFSVLQSTAQMDKKTFSSYWSHVGQLGVDITC
jgi:membrane protein insertase Oxa1/YidC/SpoIIIJ